MNDTSNPNQPQDFRLISYLDADLRRAQELLHQTNKPVSSMKLWLGILSPRFVPVLLCRLAYFFHLLKLDPIAKIISLLNFWFFGIEIAVCCPIGKGLFFTHTQGTVIGAFKIGVNAVIYQGTTFGSKNLDFTYDSQHRPTLGDNVTIGSGAVILGGIHVGDNTIIGANSVVTRSTLAGSTVVGIPARPVSTSQAPKSDDV